MSNLLGSREFELLRACCAALPQSASSAGLGTLIGSVVDWVEFRRLAEHHGVGPLVYRNLPSLLQPIPSPILDQLRSDCEGNAQKSLLLAQELLEILACLESAGIPAIPFKGPVLAQDVYGDISLRRFADLDILIRAADIPRAKLAVRELCYAPAFSLNETQERAYLKSASEWPFDGPRGTNLLELQWQILPRFYSVDFCIENFFRRASVVDIGDKKVLTLSPEDLLLVLCVHGAKHFWSRLLWMCDIAATVRLKSIDFDFVFRAAADLGIVRIIAVNFWLLNELFGIPFPPQLHGKRLEGDSEVGRLAQMAWEVLSGGLEYKTPSIDYFRSMLRLRERLQDKLRFLLRLVFTPSIGEWSVVRLPAFFSPLYYGIRLYRLAGRFTPRAVAK